MTRSRAVELQLFRTKSPDHLIAEAAAPERQMKRTLSLIAAGAVTIFHRKSASRAVHDGIYRLQKPMVKTHSLLILPGRKRIRSEPSALNELNNKHNDGNNEQKMNQAASHMEAEPQQPQNQKYNENCPKHNVRLLRHSMMSELANSLPDRRIYLLCFCSTRVPSVLYRPGAIWLPARASFRTPGRTSWPVM